MGGCVHKGNDIISIRINEQSQNENYKFNQKYQAKRHLSIPFVFDKKLKDIEHCLPVLYSNELSNILKISDFNNNGDDLKDINSLRKIVNLLNWDIEKYNNSGIINLSIYIIYKRLFNYYDKYIRLCKYYILW